MISSVCWVRKGAAKAQPFRQQIDEEELAELQEAQQDEEVAVAKESLMNKEDAASDSDEEDDEMNDEEEEDTRKVMVADPIAAKYNLDSYDENTEEEYLSFLVPEEVRQHLSGVNDPVVTSAGFIDEEEEEDVRIRETDAILVAASTEDDQFSHLNIYVYEEEEKNLYIHHDIVMGEFPLCVEWIGHIFPTEPGTDEEREEKNHIAVGTFKEEIEIWNLDVLDILEPFCVLGGREAEPNTEFTGSASTKRKKKRKMKKRGAPAAALKAGSHAAAVMSLSWNSAVSNILASGSADHTAKIWDLNTLNCVHTFTHHTDKVQACKWHPTEPNILLTGAYDKTVCVVDARAPENVMPRRVQADVESVDWNPHQPKQYFVSSEDGLVTCYDMQLLDRPLFTLHAHDGPASGVSVHPYVPGCFATCSVDKSLKIWCVRDGVPSVLYQNDSLGKSLYSLAWNRDSPFLLALGGKGVLEVVDMSGIDVVRNYFASASQQQQ